MKRKHVMVIFAALALTVFGVFAVSAQEATAVPEATVEVTGEDAESRPYLGIIFVDSDGSVLVEAVPEDGAAAAAGIEAGDVITAIDGEAVNAGNVSDVLGSYAVGDTVSVEVTRGDESLTFDVTLGAIPEGYAMLPDMRQPRFETFRVERPRLGITLADNEEGVIVSAVQPDSPAEAAGVEVDDVITAVNDEAVATPQEAVEAVAQAIANAVPGEFDVTLSITRGEETLDLTATLVKPEGMMRGMPDFDFEGFDFRGRPDSGLRFATPGLRIAPREGEEGAFDVIVPFTPSDPAAVTPEVIEALAALGIRLEPREDEAGVFDLILPAESLGGGMGMMLPNLEGMLPDGLQFSLRGPRGSRFMLPQIPNIFFPSAPDSSEGSI